MIRVVYDRQNHTVRAKGHGGGEYGKDLVCAAVSTLMYTLAEVVDSIGPILDDAEMALDSGDGMIRAETGVENDGVVTLLFDAVCKGFRFLEREWPEYIQYTVTK